MKIKSLLLGSAASLIAATTAQAADAIVFEPEPMEYVKVCDMYGAGFFYIPGTETCLKIGGAVRVQYGATDNHGDGDISDHQQRVYGYIHLTANNETEYGTLGSHVRFVMETSGSNPHDNFSGTEFYGAFNLLYKGTINLAGFRAGFDITTGGAWNRFTGYGWYNSMGGTGGSTGGYHFSSALFVQYEDSVAGINYAVGIQDDAVSGSPGQPDPYIGVSGSAGGLSWGAVVVYDSNGGDTVDGDGAIAYAVRGDYDLSSFIPGGSIGAWWEDDNGETDYRKGHQWGITAKANLTDKLVLAGGWSQYDGYNARTDTDLGTTRLGYTSLTWNVATGLYIRGQFTKYVDTGAHNFTLRAHRSF